MSRGKQILLLRSQGFSQRKIADMLHVSRNTVARVFQAATEVPIPCDALEDLNEVEIHQRLFLRGLSSQSWLRRTMNMSTRNC